MLSHNTICFGLSAYSGERREYRRTYERMPLKIKHYFQQVLKLSALAAALDKTRESSAFSFYNSTQSESQRGRAYRSTTLPSSSSSWFKQAAENSHLLQRQFLPDAETLTSALTHVKTSFQQQPAKRSYSRAETRVSLTEPDKPVHKSTAVASARYPQVPHKARGERTPSTYPPRHPPFASPSPRSRGQQRLRRVPVPGPGARPLPAAPRPQPPRPAPRRTCSRAGAEPPIRGRGGARGGGVTTPFIKSPGRGTAPPAAGGGFLGDGAGGGRLPGARAGAPPCGTRGERLPLAARRSAGRGGGRRCSPGRAGSRPAPAAPVGAGPLGPGRGSAGGAGPREGGSSPGPHTADGGQRHGLAIPSGCLSAHGFAQTFQALGERPRERPKFAAQRTLQASQRPRPSVAF
ncbi:uncharacterized protein J5F26_010660 [Ciconia maguari]